MAEIQGFRINRQIVCQLCKIKRPKGGFMVKSGPAPGVYCSAQHARDAVERAQKGGDSNASKSQTLR